MQLPLTASYALHALMYMVRHLTQLPVTVATIGKAEGIPLEALNAVFGRMVQAGFIKPAEGQSPGYVFAKAPERIHLLELFESVVETPLFPTCLMQECRCGGTPETCLIKEIWSESIERFLRKLTDTNLVAVTWNHPSHRLDGKPHYAVQTIAGAPKIQKRNSGAIS